MLLTLLGWLLIVSSLAISAMLIFQFRSSEARGEPLDIGTCKARLEDIEAFRKLGKINEAEADAEKLAVLSRLWFPGRVLGPGLRGSARTLILPAVVFFLVACVGAAISYVSAPLEVAGSGSMSSSSRPESGSDDEMLARLEDYTRSIATEEPASMAAAGKLLPDVNTMIERLAARLEATPNDVQGWRMLGWSYFNTEHFEQAATAYARALALDPNSAELKLAYEEAKTKASKSDNSAASSVQTGAVDQGGDGLAVEINRKAHATRPDGRDAEIRSMVDGLADRLESSPRDLEGWTRLMRSRVALGERAVAAAAFHNALEVFKDDAAASGKIIAAAIELDLQAE